MANLPIPAPLSEVDYEQIEGAVMETARGRWFLAEYARRNRNADTTMLLKALDRIEASIGGKRSVEPVDRIRFDLIEMSKAIEVSPSHTSPGPLPSASRMASSRLVSARCGTTTPLGRPVEPEVNMT